MAPNLPDLVHNASETAGASVASTSVPPWSESFGSPTGIPVPEVHVACQLLATPFGWWLQVLLGCACFITLVGKRFMDRVRRPWKVWFFDTSKQGLSALLIHFLNILLSMAFREWLDTDADACNWYWINLTLDDTFGVFLLFVLLRVQKCIYRSRCVGRPDLAMAGEYGNPPECRMFARQLVDWQILVIIAKVFLGCLVVNFTDEVASVAYALLSWLDPHPRAKLVVVMVWTPLAMNVFALWIADSFLQGDPTKPEEQALVAGGLPRIVGQSGSATNTTEDPSGDEDERILSFQEWKKRSASPKGQPRKA